MLDLEKLFKPLQSVRLKEYEREQMRASLMSYMREHPMKPKAWTRFMREMTVLTLSIRIHPVVTAFVLVLCVATGTSYAAENALPGEALYVVKTSVNEKAVGAFAVSHAAKVEWGAKLADRRLSEAEVLVAEGRLTSVAAASIQSGLADATRSFDDSVLASATNESDTNIADAQSDLQASLQAHVHVLSALQTSSSTDPAPVTEILQAVHNRAKGIAEGRSKTQKNVTKDQSSKMRDVLTAKKQDAEEAVQTLHALAASAKDSFGTTTSDDVTAGALQAAERIQTGTKRLDEGDFSGALGSYQAAIRAAKETKISLEAAKHVRKNLRSRREESNKSDNVATPPTAATMMMKMDAPPVAAMPPIQPEQVPAPALMMENVRSGFERHGGDDHEESDEDSVRVELRF